MSQQQMVSSMPSPTKRKHEDDDPDDDKDRKLKDPMHARDVYDNVTPSMYNNINTPDNSVDNKLQRKKGRGGKREGAGRKKKTPQPTTMANPLHPHPNNLLTWDSTQIQLQQLQPFVPGPPEKGASQAVSAANSVVTANPAALPPTEKEEDIALDDIASTIIALNQKFFRYTKKESLLLNQITALKKEKEDLIWRLNDLSKQRDHLEQQVNTMDARLKEYLALLKANDSIGEKKLQELESKAKHDDKKEGIEEDEDEEDDDDELEEHKQHQQHHHQHQHAQHHPHAHPHEVHHKADKPNDAFLQDRPDFLMNTLPSSNLS